MSTEDLNIKRQDSRLVCGLVRQVNIIKSEYNGFGTCPCISCDGNDCNDCYYASCFSNNICIKCLAYEGKTR